MGNAINTISNDVGSVVSNVGQGLGFSKPEQQGQGQQQPQQQTQSPSWWG